MSAEEKRTSLSRRGINYKIKRVYTTVPGIQQVGMTFSYSIFVEVISTDLEYSTWRRAFCPAVIIATATFAPFPRMP